MTIPVTICPSMVYSPVRMAEERAQLVGDPNAAVIAV
eukprot:CAMPEP_0183319306 /NCGR_PEP_ID=MMETSP0160_2-20130417/63175_1 /TAXON_ID=2839 ORGANISM="Odontella Sinensis, Strain Grunow 1884" /NCGR_SAMPLE_ID=MMETSP0160_2 /ASSEMBLY_ACC=CAM_ASM_000250 /LENGTH=36 /DNA_ID= /DNA_START= /DNA_END= /DNA_ORIENTATION=